MVKKIEMFVDQICCELEINQVTIICNSSVFLTNTQLAALIDGVLYLPENPVVTPDLFFSIAHELRHAWQIKNDKEAFFYDYRTSDLIPLEDYNNQIAEVDAHAFATLVMINRFRLQPLYHGLSKKTVDLIEKRINQISK